MWSEQGDGQVFAGRSFYQFYEKRPESREKPGACSHLHLTFALAPYRLCPCRVLAVFPLGIDRSGLVLYPFYASVLVETPSIGCNVTDPVLSSEE